MVDFVLRLVKALTHCLTEETSAEDAEEVEPVGEVSSERRAPVLRRQLRRLLDSVDEGCLLVVDLDHLSTVLIAFLIFLRFTFTLYLLIFLQHTQQI